MFRFFLSLACMLAVASDCFGQSCGGVAAPSCSGARATPIRNLIAARPVATVLDRIRCNAQARRSAACSGRPVRAPSCCGSAVPMAPAPQAGSCGCSNCGCGCSNCGCGAAAVESSPVVVHNMTPVVSDVYRQALASAQYRAANGIRGHTHLDTHRTSGVGWASHNSMPSTCLGVGVIGQDYAVVQGADGFYSTRFQ